MKIYQIDGMGISNEGLFVRVVKKESDIGNSTYTVLDIIKNEIVVHFGYDKEIQLKVLLLDNTENQIELKVVLVTNKLLVNQDSFINLCTNDLFRNLFAYCDLYTKDGDKIKYTKD
jgi:hypothetical protein